VAGTDLGDRQRVLWLWPSTIQLSLPSYFHSLQEHAVPLNEADLVALAHSTLGIDLYSWPGNGYAGSIPIGRPSLLPVLKQQFDRQPYR
jgi:hypothetical protein